MGGYLGGIKHFPMFCENVGGQTPFTFLDGEHLLTYEGGQSNIGTTVGETIHGFM
tara:strand:+ start:1386 stop:1550 length:165 start_codon:yes stop_codon:yes gene_type:complete